MALDFFAGCLGGCAGVIVGHPLDTVKVHLQTQDPRTAQYKGSYDCLKSLVIKDGIRGLYRGISSPLSGVAAINAVIFGVYANVQRRQKDPNTLSSCLVAGAVTGLSQSFLTSPMELVKTRMQLSGDNGSAIKVLRNIYTSEGIRGVFRGLSITMAREVPAFSSYFLTYECLTRTKDNSAVSTMRMLMAGGMAGVVSWIICYPVDIIKSRMQVDGMRGVTTYTSSLDCLRKSVSSEGYVFLVRGLTPAVVRAFPVNAVCFTVVTWTMRLLDEATTYKETSDISMWDTLVYNMHNTADSSIMFL